MIQNEPHSVKARVWEWQGKGAWHFATIPKEDSALIKNDWNWPRKGFGSIPVTVTLGTTSWQTSIFPEKDGTYVLPLKKEVRKKEGIHVGEVITFKLRVNS